MHLIGCKKAFDEDKTKQNAAEVVEITSKEIEKIPSEKELEIMENNKNNNTFICKKGLHQH